MMDCTILEDGKAICTTERSYLVGKPAYIVGKPKLSKISGRMMKIIVLNNYEGD